MANSASTGAPSNLSTADRLATMIVKQPAPFLQKPDAFARELLPTVFKHNNYTSFVRQLNIYGFRKLPAPNQEFCHLCFKRGQPQLLSQICRGGMPSSSATADGPAAEINNLKSQVDKLSKALTYALAELHRRGFATLRFDWKELVFVDASASLPQPAVLAKHEAHAQHSTAAAKRAATSGSMLHLQNSVDEMRGGAIQCTPSSIQAKVEDGAPAAKVAKLSGQDGTSQAMVHPHAHPHAAHPQHAQHVQHAHMMPPGMPGPGAYAMAPMHPQAVPSMQHAQPLHGTPAAPGHIHGDPAVPGPYMSMHGIPAHAGAVDMTMHVQPHSQALPAAGQGQPQAPDDVPAPSDSVGLYDMHEPHMPSTTPASVPMPPLATHDSAAPLHPQPAQAQAPNSVPASSGQGTGAPAVSMPDAPSSSGLDVNQLMGAIHDCSSKDEILSRVKEMVDSRMGGGGAGPSALPADPAPDGGMHDGAEATDSGLHGSMGLGSSAVAPGGQSAASGSLPGVTEAT